jgi:oxygen-dependent protoporphyrinogen oxidase
MSSRRIVVAGGGITGLTAAYRLLASRGGSEARPVVTVLEARESFGGNIRTERPAGYVIDGGPDSFVATKPEATALCKELGLGDQLIETTAKNRKVYVGRQGKLHNLPEGIMLTVPTKWLPLFKSPLIGWGGKLRMAMEPFIKARRDGVDEPLGRFIERRLGKECLDRIAEPLLGGIYAGDIHALSARSTFPQLVDFEVQHGSLVRGATALMMKRGKGRSKTPPSAFQSLLGGMGELIAALERRTKELGASLRTGARVVRVERPALGESAAHVVIVATAAGEERLLADHVIFATPAYVAADALADLAPEVSATLREIPYVSTGTIALAFTRADVPHPLDASGVIFPRSEPRKILATTFVSSKWTGRAPEDVALVRVFVGGAKRGEDLALTDDGLVELARAELAELFNIRAKPLFSRVFRYERGNPQPTVGHGERLAALRKAESTYPGLHFVGAAYDGVGIPDCVRQASQVADRVFASWGGS